jgi:hypothetical protein
MVKSSAHDTPGARDDEHRPWGMPAAYREAEAAAGRHRVTGALGHKRRPGLGHGGGIGQGFQFVVHIGGSYWPISQRPGATSWRACAGPHDPGAY